MKALGSKVCVVGLAIGASVLMADSAWLLAPTGIRVSKVSSEKEGSVRTAIQHAIPFIEEEGNAWIREKRCITCHQIPYMHWSLNLANSKEFSVDESRLEENNAWVANWVNFTNPDRRNNIRERSTLETENDAIAALLLGSLYRDELKSKMPEWMATYRASLIDSQQVDGSWEPLGQLPKQARSLNETTQVSTMWAMIAIGTSGKVSKDSATLIAAKEFLGKGNDGVSTEWLAARMLFEHRFGAAADMAVLREKLLNAQNQDGGWGWLLNDGSDAFGTGLTLFALQRVGVRVDEPTIVKAQSYLVETQTENGSWEVNGTKKADRKHPTATATYWGTCWAVIGLLETLPTENLPEDLSRK